MPKFPCRTPGSPQTGSQVWPCSSPVLDDGTLPVVPEVLQDDVFTPPSSPRRGSSTTVMALSTPDTAPSDPDNGGLRGQAFSLLAMITLVCVLSYRPSTTADRFALHNKYGVVGNRYHLTAYDCSDPTEVQAYSSIPAMRCSVRATLIQRKKPTRFQLLKREKKRYITTYSCSLSRTDLRYNCGVYGHLELDPIHWSFSVPQRVTFEQCLTWQLPAFHLLHLDAWSGLQSSHPAE